MTVRMELTDEMKLGVRAIDSEHQELIDLGNRFLDSAESGASNANLTAALDEMIASARRHFLDEEQLLDRNGYPSLAAHKADHHRLLSEAETLRGHLTTAGEDAHHLALEAAVYLRSWLVDHILTADKPYRPFLMRLA